MRDVKWMNRAKKVPTDVTQAVRQDYELAKERKNMKKARVKPKGYWLRKLGVALFWLAFLFVLLIIGNSFFKTDEVASEDKQAPSIVKVTSIEATEFAKRFTRAYFTFSPADDLATTREKALQPFLASNVEAFAGLDVLTSLYQSSVVATEILDVKQLSERTSHITVKATQQLTAVKKADEQGITDIPKEEQTTEFAVQYLVVPVGYDEQFFVYGNPMFTYVEEPDVSSSVTVGNLKEVPIEVMQDIQAFLPTFFKAYTTDEQEQLNYLLETDNLAISLQESMIFEEVRSTKAYMLKDGWLVFATVKLLDPKTNIPVETTYQLEIKQAATNQLVVSGFNNYESFEVN